MFIDSQGLLDSDNVEELDNSDTLLISVKTSIFHQVKYCASKPNYIHVFYIH